MQIFPIMCDNFLRTLSIAEIIFVVANKDINNE